MDSVTNSARQVRLGAEDFVAAGAFLLATTRLVTEVSPRCRVRGPLVVRRLSLGMRVSICAGG